MTVSPVSPKYTDRTYGLVSVKSRVLVEPSETVTVSDSGEKPMRITRTVYGPGGMASRLKCPLASVTAPRPVDTRTTLAPTSGEPSLPVTVPVSVPPGVEDD